jgi:hypothetical protein
LHVSLLILSFPIGIFFVLQVSPWGTRQLLMALSVDCSVLEELKATNYSLLVLVCPGVCSRVPLSVSLCVCVCVCVCLSLPPPPPLSLSSFSLCSSLYPHPFVPVSLSARGEVDEMNYVERSPRRPPYIRLDGRDCTLFAVCVLLNLCSASLI